MSPAPNSGPGARLKPKDLEALQRKAAQDHVGFWADLAREQLAWHKPFTIALDDHQAPNYRWFTDGELNVSYNCLDVHLEERGHKTAIIFVGEPGDTRRLTYRELHCRGVPLRQCAARRRASRPATASSSTCRWCPRPSIAMQACARIGAMHSVVFGGFSAAVAQGPHRGCRRRGSCITADGGWRGGKWWSSRRRPTRRWPGAAASIEKVIVLKRTGHDVDMRPGRDVWWHDVIAGQPPVCEPVWVNAEHPLYLLYTSGSTGKPKGIQHSSAGYLLGAKLTSQWVFDLNDDDVFWCTADVGWVTGHSYVAYGPLAAGATIVMYEGAPTHPGCRAASGRSARRHGVTIFYTAPTAIRALMKLGEDIPAKYDLIEAAAAGHASASPSIPKPGCGITRVIGKGRCPIVDTWWQTETGAIMISPLPGVTPTKPGSCTQPLPGHRRDDRGRATATP